MTLLNKVKDEVAQKYGRKNWQQIKIEVYQKETDAVDFEYMLNEAAELYAIEMCKQQRELCAKNIVCYKDRVTVNGLPYNQDSILNAPLPNELKE